MLCWNGDALLEWEDEREREESFQIFQMRFRRENAAEVHGRQCDVDVM
jgi:hypothetical protein